MHCVAHRDRDYNSSVASDLCFAVDNGSEAWHICLPLNHSDRMISNHARPSPSAVTDGPLFLVQLGARFATANARDDPCTRFLVAFVPVFVVVPLWLQLHCCSSGIARRFSCFPAALCLLLSLQLCPCCCGFQHGFSRVLFTGRTQAKGCLESGSARNDVGQW